MKSARAIAERVAYEQIGLIDFEGSSAVGFIAAAIRAERRRYASLAKLLRDAAYTISAGVEGSFGHEEGQHPMARGWRRVQRRCDKAANMLANTQERKK